VNYVRENPFSEFSSGLLYGELWFLSDEHDERFHQDIAAVEGIYKGKWSPSLLADYCWTLMRDSPNSTFIRQAK
jgi:hypothetical protein